MGPSTGGSPGSEREVEYRLPNGGEDSTGAPIGLVNALYIEGGIRGVELGSVMFGRKDADGNEVPAPLELVRLAFPRRVYTQSHFDYLMEVIEAVWQARDVIPGYRITQQPEFLRHFTCHFEPLSSA